MFRSTFRKISIFGYNQDLPTVAEGVITSVVSDLQQQPQQDDASTSGDADETQDGAKRRRKTVRLCGDMYEQWPALEFSDLNSSILDLFTKSTSQSVASSLLYELTRSDADENGASIRLNNEEHLKWCMQVLNHSLTLSFATGREYETLKGAVRIYLHWLRALCDTPDNNIPTPLLETPEKYFRNIIDALRWVFCRRGGDDDACATLTSQHVPRGLAIERQSIEIDMILDALKYLTRGSSRKYQDEVWARSLSFLLNSADILLSEPAATEEMGTRICVRVAETLFDMWLNAVILEHIPSLTYWSSLATLAKRWRHNIPIIEVWAKKILGLSVLVCRKMYGEDYLKIDIVDDSVSQFGNVPICQDDDENEVHLLFRTWYNMLCLFDSPAKILEHDASRNMSLNGNSPKRTFSSVSEAASSGSNASVAAQGVSFFLAATTLQRMVDLFYGDSRVAIDLRTAQELKTPTTATRAASIMTDHTNRTASTAGESSRFVSLNGPIGQIIVEDVSQVTSLASGSSANTKSSNVSDTTRQQQHKSMSSSRGGGDATTSHRTESTTVASRVSEQTTSTLTYKSAPPPHIVDAQHVGESISHIVANSAISAPPAIAQHQQQETKKASQASPASPFSDTAAATSPNRAAMRFVTNFLTANPATQPYAGNRNRPKTDRMLSLVGDWLFGIVNTTATASASQRNLANTASTATTRRNNDGVSDDVISGLSLHSVDLDDIPDAMNAAAAAAAAATSSGRSDSVGYSSTASNRRKSVGSSCSSSVAGGAAGEAASDVVSSTSTYYKTAEDAAAQPHLVDGVTAGRAAALASLIRIICAKSSTEKIPNAQLANFYATIFQTLVEKDRIMLCTLFYYGRNLFRLGLPGIESLLPHFLFALDIVMIESSKLRLHPSISEVEIRRACLRALSSVICWPTTFGMSRIPQIADAAGLKSNAATYLHLRSRIFKTLMFSVRNETDAANLHTALALCAVLVEESCQFDLGLNEEQTKEMIRISTTSSSTGQPEKGLCASIVRGVLSAVCDKMGRVETIDAATALAIIDVLNCISHCHHTVLFNNMDVSTGTLVIASMCRFIEQQLSKPPPMHSKDLHSTVVAAFNAVAVWLTAAPLLAECVGVLGTVCDVIQLGVTGSKTSASASSAATHKPASQRVLEAAEALMYTLFCVVGRRAAPLSDERRLAHRYAAADATVDASKFLHILVNGDTLLSLHEASHIDELEADSAAVVYVRRSPMQSANTGVARLRPRPVAADPCVGDPAATLPPMTPMSAVSQDGFEDSSAAKLSTCSLDLPSSNMSVGKVSMTSRVTTRTAPPAISTGSIFSGVSNFASPTMFVEEDEEVDDREEAYYDVPNTPPARPPAQKSIGEQFVIPPDFYKNTCQLDGAFRNLESTSETEAIAEEMKLQNAAENGGKRTFFDEARRQSIFERMTADERRVKPLQPNDRCSSIRLMLYDFGLINENIFGTEIVVLDSAAQSEKFYKDLHETVDCSPARYHQTAHIFYVKEGQRNAVDILENSLNVQNTCADFCQFLSALGEGVEIGVHDTWTGHWSTAFSSERKPQKESDPVDHYIFDGIQHALWWCDEHGGANSELAFLMPTERSVRMFKQTITSPASSSRRGSNNNNNNSKEDNRSFDSSTHTDASGMLGAPSSRRGEKSPSNLSDRDFRPYAGGGSSMGGGPSGAHNRRTCALRIMLVWLERAEDMQTFPVHELLGACDDGSDALAAAASKDANVAATTSSHHIAHHILFIHCVEPGIVQIRTRGTPTRFGDAGPLVDGVVVAAANLPSFTRGTILNSSRRDVAEIDAYQFPHTRRKQAILEFAKRYASRTSFEEFLVQLIQQN